MEDRINQVRTLSGINVLAGLWLIIAPFVLAYGSGANRIQEVIFGIVIAVLAIARLSAVEAVWLSWVNFIIGLWLILAPWTMDTSTAAKWNEVILGIIVAVLAYISAQVTRHLHHHA